MKDDPDELLREYAFMLQGSASYFRDEVYVAGCILLVPSHTVVV
jgi:hypothetical protein